ncbi:MAG: C1 family peptidase [Bacteroidales bacterium]|nr:C1 family peptidase [Bacteroidales bacterium]
MKKITLIALAMLSIAAYAQNNGGITPEMLAEISKAWTGSASDKALRNAIATTPINTLALNAENAAMIDTEFSDRIKTRGITDQKSSGRCWLFTGLNVLRAAAIDKWNLGDFQFSQCYCFFWDQLEKANLFLQAIIDTRDKPIDDREVDWLFSHPIGDGGTFTGVSNLVTKYGLVPASVMPETAASNATAQMRAQLSNLLRQDGFRLRDMWEQGIINMPRKAGLARQKHSETILNLIQQEKVSMLKEVYHVLSLCLGVPPSEFEWKGEKTTPKKFYQDLLGYDLENNYVMLMNDPSREYGKVYEIQYDRHMYDGQNWFYLNLPIERIKEMAIASIKANTAMYFSCDVAKFLDRNRGVADLSNFDYDSLLGVEFNMDKKQRIQTHASGSSHAMTLIAVDIKDGKPAKWMVENSWGAKSGYKGNIIMTDEWFNEYMFRLVVEKRFVPADVLAMLKQEAVMLPAWDPMFAVEE